MNKLYFVFLFLSPFIIKAQEDAEACNPPDKKVMKLIEAGQKSPDFKTAGQNFAKAMEADEDNAMAFYEFGKLCYDEALKAYSQNPNPKLGNSYFNKSKELLIKALDICPHYHADACYMIGYIYYSFEDQQNAKVWFEKFVDFDIKDNWRAGDKFAEKESAVKKLLAKWTEAENISKESVPFDPAMVPNVSSPSHEYFPMISPDNEIMYYTRVVDTKNLGDGGSWTGSQFVKELFHFSKRPDMYSEFDSGTIEEPPFNNDPMIASYGAATLAVDNKEMIVCACKDTVFNSGGFSQPYKNCDLYTTTYLTGDDGKIHWTPLINMGPLINSPDGWEGQPSLSADGKTLFYTVVRQDTRDNDIFVAYRGENGKWGKARPFDVINTDGKDKSPFLHQDSETLYFVSQVSKTRPGVGGLDIFYIRKDEHGKWTEPKNIGYPINTADDELGIFVSIDGEIAYYSSSQRGDWNIYSFELYEEARPQSVALIKGELKDDSGQPVKDATIQVMYEGADTLTEIKVNGDDGKYAAIVKTKKNQDVMVTVKTANSAFESKLITKEELAEPKKIKIEGKDMDVKEMKVGEPYTINDILYATNSFELSSRTKFILRGFAQFLKENPSVAVAIHGHTDDIGDDHENLVLSKNRAKGVMDYLVAQGVAKKRLSSEGFGETKPKVSNSSEENRAQNRRTEFVIQGM